MHIKNPVHPGEFLNETYLKPLNMSRTDLAKKIGVSLASVSRLVSGKSDLSVDMAIKLSNVFDRTALGWLSIQMHYSLGMAKAA